MSAINQSTDSLRNIHSIHILQKLFDYLSKKRALIFCKINKHIQNRLNLSINDYKEFSQIKIEIIPKEDEEGKFINIINKDQERYFNIYFNGTQKEEKTTNLSKGHNVKKIEIIIDYQIKSFEKLFADCNNIEYIWFKQFNRNNITSMSQMFYWCYDLKGLYLSSFNTDNVIDMNKMFEWCPNLTELKINFNTNKVRNMSGMFNQCKKLNN